MTNRGKKITGGIAISGLLLLLLPFLADPSGCGTELDVQDREDVYVIEVHCPFRVSSEHKTAVIETDKGTIVIGEETYKLEPEGQECPGHVLRVTK